MNGAGVSDIFRLVQLFKAAGSPEGYVFKHPPPLWPPEAINHRAFTARVFPGFGQVQHGDPRRFPDIPSPLMVHGLSCAFPISAIWCSALLAQLVLPGAIGGDGVGFIRWDWPLAGRPRRLACGSGATAVGVKHPSGDCGGEAIMVFRVFLSGREKIYTGFGHSWNGPPLAVGNGPAEIFPEKIESIWERLRGG